MSDIHQANSPEARAADGTMLDQSPKATDTTGSNPEQSQNQPDPTKAAPDQSKTDPQSKSTDAKSDAKPGDKSLLNEEKKEAKAGAPEKYEDFKVPKGITLEGDLLTEATTLFKDSGLSQEAAQKFVDFHTKTMQAALEAPLQSVKDNIDGWRKEVTEDPNLGPRLTEIKTNYSRMLDSLGDPAMADAFREAMDFTGVGNHPAFIRVIDKLSQHFTEGKSVQGGKPAPTPQPGKPTGTGAHAVWPGLPTAS